MDGFTVRILHGWSAVDPINDNVDVCVTLNNEEYPSTFFTLKNVETLMNRWRESGEHASGLYFWAADLVIVRELTQDTVQRTIEDLLRSGAFPRAFERVDSG
jgi:hypothetical protein